MGGNSVPTRVGPAVLAALLAALPIAARKGTASAG